MVKIALCDDDERELVHLVELVKKYQTGQGVDLNFRTYRSGVDLVEDVREGDFDLILLDVLMPGYSGIQAAREIRTFNVNIKILFLTSSPEFAVESYAVGAFHYLLKPVKEEMLFPLLNKALSFEAKQEGATIAVKTRTGLTRIAFDRLEYLEVMRKTVSFHLTDGSVVEVFGALAVYEEELLARPEFVKVQRSYLVNLRHVETLERGAITTRFSHQIPLSRAFYPKIKEEYMRFLFDTKTLPDQVKPPSKHEQDGAYHILLVDDDLSQLIRWTNVLKNKGCKVDSVKNGKKAEELAAEKHYDCVLLDVMLCGESGFDHCEQLHSLTGAPVIFLSSLTDPDSQLQGFMSGGADYITKDTPGELFWMKVDTRIRLSRASSRTLLCFDPLVLDLNQRNAVIKEQEIAFTHTEFDLLWMLAVHAGQVYSPEELHRCVWGAREWDGGQTIQVHMSRMRRKLEKAYPDHFFVETVWGEGYRFAPCEEE